MNVFSTSNQQSTSAASLLEAAKTSSESYGKLLKLQQLRSVILSDPRDSLPTILPEILNFGRQDKSTATAQFLIHLFGELVDVDANLTATNAITLFATFQQQGSPLVRAAVAKELSRIYAKVILTLSSNGAGSATSTKIKGRSGLGGSSANKVQECTQAWTAFTTMMNEFRGYVTTPSSEILKLYALQLLEAEILFWLPGNSETSAATEGGKMEDIPASHPFINVAAMQREAEDSFTKICHWATKGGPVGSPFSPRFLSSLGQILVKIGLHKSSKTSLVAKSLTTLISGTGKGSRASAMSDMDLDALRLAIQQLLDASITIESDEESIMGKLLKAVVTVDNSSSVLPAHVDVIDVVAPKLIGKKRAAGKISKKDADSDSDDELNAAVVADYYDKQDGSNAEEAKQRMKPRSCKGRTFEDVYEALRCFKRLYPDLSTVSKNYVIPEGTDAYPERLWGMKLGSTFIGIKHNGAHKDHHDEIAELGFNLSCSFKMMRHEITDIISALAAFKKVHPESESVPSKFVVPENSSEFPESTHGMRLGLIFGGIKKGDAHRQYRNQILGMGYNLDLKRRRSAPEGDDFDA